MRNCQLVPLSTDGALSSLLMTKGASIIELGVAKVMSEASKVLKVIVFSI
jgi:hypothetical protein